MNAPDIARSVDALPSTGLEIPFVAVVETASGSHYVIAVPPEGRARSMRLSFYGWANFWDGYVGSYALGDARDQPVTVGLPARFHFSRAGGDYYSSTPVTRIELRHVSAMLSLDEVEALAREAMIESVITGFWRRHHEGIYDMYGNAADLAASLEVPVERILNHPAGVIE